MSDSLINGIPTKNQTSCISLPLFNAAREKDVKPSVVFKPNFGRGVKGPCDTMTVLAMGNTGDMTDGKPIAD
jgi:hypothetical protein